MDAGQIRLASWPSAARTCLSTAGSSVTVGDRRASWLQTSRPATVTITDQVLVGFNNLACRVGPGAVLINKGISSEVDWSFERGVGGWHPIADEQRPFGGGARPLPAVGGDQRLDVTVNTNTSTVTVGGDSAIVGSLATGNITVNNPGESDLNAAFGIDSYGVLGGFDNITGGVNVHGD